MKVEGNFCGIDELTIGISMNYGEDEVGSFHMIALGLLFFEISLIKYLNTEIS